MISETRMMHQDIYSDCMSNFNFQDILSETSISQTLRTELRRHQHQDLFFMLERERGWSYIEDLKDIWKTTIISDLLIYQNIVNDDIQLKPSQQFCGGLLFNNMDLSKTLTVIALVISDLKMRIDLQIHDQHIHIRCILVIVSSQLLRMWEEQLSRHIHPDRLRWYKYHESHQLVQLSQLKDYDIIFTTYNIMIAEFKSYSAISKDILLQAH